MLLVPPEEAHKATSGTGHITQASTDSFPAAEVAKTWSRFPLLVFSEFSSRIEVLKGRGFIGITSGHL